MKTLITTVLALISCVAFESAQAQPSKAPPSSSTESTIKQLAHDWADAMVAVDTDKLARIIAEDWVDGYPGKLSTRGSFLDDVRSGKHKLDAYEYGPLEVKVLGDVAVLQGSITEQRKVDGQPATWHVAFMDVYVKRGDRWVAVRSQAKKL